MVAELVELVLLSKKFAESNPNLGPFCVCIFYPCICGFFFFWGGWRWGVLQFPPTDQKYQFKLIGNSKMFLGVRYLEPKVETQDSLNYAVKAANSTNYNLSRYWTQLQS